MIEQFYGLKTSKKKYLLRTNTQLKSQGANNQSTYMGWSKRLCAPKNRLDHLP